MPLIPGALDLARRNRSGGLGTNEAHFQARVSVSPSIDADLLTLLYDPQTSGGLLIIVDPAHDAAAMAALAAAGVAGARIGVVIDRAEGAVIVV